MPGFSWILSNHRGDRARSIARRVAREDFIAIVNRVINEYSHMFSRLERGSRPVDTPDLIRAAQYVLEALKRDTVQYDALLQSIGRQSKSLE